MAASPSLAVRELVHDRHGRERVVARGRGAADLDLRRRHAEIRRPARYALFAEQLGHFQCHDCFLPERILAESLTVPTCRNAGSRASFDEIDFLPRVAVAVHPPLRVPRRHVVRRRRRAPARPGCAIPARAARRCRRCRSPAARPEQHEPLLAAARRPYSRPRKSPKNRSTLKRLPRMLATPRYHGLRHAARRTIVGTVIDLAGVGQPDQPPLAAAGPAQPRRFDLRRGLAWRAGRPAPAGTCGGRCLAARAMRGVERVRQPIAAIFASSSSRLTGFTM